MIKLMFIASALMAILKVMGYTTVTWYGVLFPVMLVGIYFIAISVLYGIATGMVKLGEWKNGKRS